jgi:hypothetical protein
MLDGNIEECQLRTAQYVHEIVLALSNWASANKLQRLARYLRVAAIEAADVYHAELAVHQNKLCVRHLRLNAPDTATTDESPPPLARDVSS